MELVLTNFEKLELIQKRVNSVRHDIESIIIAIFEDSDYTNLSRMIQNEKYVKLKNTLPEDLRDLINEGIKIRQLMELGSK